MRANIFRLFIVVSCCLPLQFSAQTPVEQIWEFGIWGGAANYFGDISASLKETPKVTRPAFGIYNRINFNSRLALKTSLNYGTITAADEYSDIPFNQARNLSFKSDILEAAVQMEFNFFNYILGHRRYKFSPYVFLGIAVFKFNPKAELNGQWYELQPLGTEGQQYPDYSGVKPYKLIQVALPYGGGLKYSVSKNLTLGIEFGYRRTFTDYLDDVSGMYVDPAVLASGTNGQVAVALADRSVEIVNEPIGIEGRQRGDSQSRDNYLFSGISFSYTFTRLRCPWPSVGGF